jgi:hypothetical protein
MSDTKIIELELEKTVLMSIPSPPELSNEVIGIYAEMMREGAKFPPIELFFDGCDYWLADGYHGILRVSRMNVHYNAKFGRVQSVMRFCFRSGPMQLTALPRNI